MHNWCQSKTYLAINQSQSFYCRKKGDDVLHEHEYDMIRTIVDQIANLDYQQIDYPVLKLMSC